MKTQQNDVKERIDERLDAVERRLPPVVSSGFRLQRRVAEQAASGTGAAVQAVRSSAKAVATVAQAATKTVAGTTKWAVTRTLDTANTAFKTVTGQVRAQSTRTADAARDEMHDLTQQAAETAEGAVETAEAAMSAAADEVRSGPSGPYENWTKDELYDRAQELDIDGRSTMNKDELIEALRAA